MTKGKPALRFRSESRLLRCGVATAHPLVDFAIGLLVIAVVVTSVILRGDLTNAVDKTTASDTISASSSSQAGQGSKAICTDFDWYVGSITVPPTVHQNSHALLTKLLAVGGSSSDASLASDGRALGKASDTGLGGLGPALANFKAACQSLGFPVT